MTYAQKMSAALVAFATAMVGIAVAVWHWTNIESAAVILAVETGSAAAVAVWTHLKVGTKKQPVALQAAVTAAGASIVGLAAAFEWFSWSLEVYGLVGTAWVALAGLLFTPLTWNSVTVDVTGQPAQPQV